MMITTKQFCKYAFSYAEEQEDLYPGMVCMPDNSFCWLIVGTSKLDVRSLTKSLAKGVGASSSLLRILSQLADAIVFAVLWGLFFIVVLAFEARVLRAGPTPNLQLEESV